MPLPFEQQFQGKGVLGFLDLCSNEPTSVLDCPSPFVSSSTTTLSSSHGFPPSGGAAAAFSVGKCNQMGFEDLERGQEESILTILMSGGDVVNPGSVYTGFDPVIDNSNPIFGYGFMETPMINQFSTGSDPPLSPPPKRLNSGQPGFQQPDYNWILPFSNPVHESHVQDQSTVIIEQLFNAAAELTGTLTGRDNNNPILAQEILARLNHNLNNNNNNNPKPPFQRAALYIIEALHSLIHQDTSASLSLSPPQTLILRIAAYKAFSQTSPFLQFINFTANQTILESIQGFDKIHIVDFDVGYGSQWSSFIQELSGRRNSSSLKITVFGSPTDESELRFTEENLKTFAGDIGVSLEIELLNIETLLNPTYWPLSLLRSSDKEAIAVNLPVSSVVSGYLPLILRFLKQITPNVVVCTDLTCDRSNDITCDRSNDAQPFPNVVIHALEYYSSLLESLDSANPSLEDGTSIERFYVQPTIQKLLTNRYRWMERSLPWRSLFGQCGFSPVGISQVAETQAEYLLQRSPMRGFHLEKRRSLSSLVLCWQRKELVAVSAWKC